MWLFADIKVRRLFYNLLIFNIFYFFIFKNILFTAFRPSLQRLLNSKTSAPLPLIIPFKLTYQFAVQLIG